MEKLSAILLFCLALPAAGPRAGEDKRPAKPAPEVAEGLRASAARVYIWPKRHEGEAPEVADLKAHLANDRPLRLGGFWWSDDEVLVKDIILPEHFISRIEVETSDGTRRFSASVSALFATARLALLRVRDAAPADSAALRPLAFAAAPPPADWGGLRVADYGPDAAGGWTLTVGGGPASLRLLDRGDAHLALPSEGLLVDGEGGPVGYAAAARGEDALLARPPLAEAAIPWRGEDLAKARRISADELAAAFDKLRERIRESVPEVRFVFRQNLEDDEAGGGYRPAGRGELDQDISELRVGAWQIGEKRLLAPCPLNRELIAKIESVAVRLPDGAEAAGRFAGALREFEGVLIDLETPLPGAPLFAIGEAPARAPAEGELFLRWRVDYATGQRRDQKAYDRPRGVMRSYRDFPLLWTFTNEAAGALAFDLDGAPLAAALAPRVPPDDHKEAYQIHKTAGFRPLGWLAERLAAPDAIDEALRPLEEEDEKRLVVFGVEAQGLNRETARWFGAEAETRGGRIGLLVAHVYPGTPAAAAGIREKDILLRLGTPARREPFDLASEAEFPWFNQLLFDFSAIPPERAHLFLQRFPPPWPPRDNPLTRLLTGIGEGREVTVEYLRGGEEKTASFITAQGPPDFNSAPKHRVRSLGLTVKPVTYEVARHYKVADPEGAVIIFHTTQGGRAQVAGLRKYLLITHVNGQPVRGFAGFKRQTAALEEGGAAEVEFTLKNLDRTHLVKIDMQSQPAAEDPGADPEDDV